MFEQCHLAFFTTAILEWKYLLKPDKCNSMIVESLRFLVQQGRVFVYGFVLMPMHLLLLRMNEPHLRENVQHDFPKFILLD